jgi:hypothetical protein
MHPTFHAESMPGKPHRAWRRPQMLRIDIENIVPGRPIVDGRQARAPALITAMCVTGTIGRKFSVDRMKAYGINDKNETKSPFCVPACDSASDDVCRSAFCRTRISGGAGLSPRFASGISASCNSSFPYISMVMVHTIIKLFEFVAAGGAALGDSLPSSLTQ